MAFVKGGKLGRIGMAQAWAYLDWKGNIGNPEARALVSREYRNPWALTKA